MSKKDKPFKFPEEFLAKLQEYSKGYCLFLVTEDDSIDVIFNPASETSYLALQEKILAVGQHMRMSRDTEMFDGEE